MNDWPMLLDKLYSIVSFDFNEGTITSAILLNKDHPVFEGHFPGNPILPGVCTLQIAKELLEKAVEKELMLTKAANIKYLGFISPLSAPEIMFTLTLNQSETSWYLCAVAVSAGGNAVCSFKGEYK